MLLAWLLSHLPSLPSLLTSGLCPFRCLFTCGWVCVVLGPCGLSNGLLCETGNFPCLCNPHRFFTARGFESLVSHTETLGFAVCLTPLLFLLAYLCANVGGHHLLGPLLCLATCPLCPSCLSLPLLLVLMNVSLTLWLLEFHANDFLAVLAVLCF